MRCFVVVTGPTLINVMGCAGAGPRDAPRAPSTLVIDATPPAPKVFVDGEYMGTLDRWRDQMLPLIAGEHRLELRAEGYYPHREDLNVEAGRTYTLRVVMVRRYD